MLIISLFVACILADLEKEISIGAICIITCVFAIMIIIFFRIFLFLKNMFIQISIRYIKSSVIILTIYWLVLLLDDFNTEGSLFIICSTLLMVVGIILGIKRIYYYNNIFEKYCPEIKIQYSNIFNYQKKIEFFEAELEKIKESDISEIIKDAIMRKDSIVPIMILYFESIYLALIIMLSVQEYLYCLVV